MKPLLSLLIVSILCTGCLSTKVRTYGSISPTEKTITVPPGGDLVGDIKDALASRGWQMVVYHGPRVTRGTFGREVNIQQSDTFNTRYSLYLDANFFDWTFPTFDRAYHYNLSIVDNRNGTEIIVMSGSDGKRRIIKKLSRALDGQLAR